MHQATLILCLMLLMPSETAAVLPSIESYMNNMQEPLCTTGLWLGEQLLIHGLQDRVYGSKSSECFKYLHVCDEIDAVGLVVSPHVFAETSASYVQQQQALFLGPQPAPQ